MLVQCDVKCGKCGEVKKPDEFYKNKKRSNGLSSYCRTCHAKKSHASPNRKENAARYYKKRKEENPALFMWKQAKHRAKWDYDDMEFTIKVEDIKIPECCPYFMVPFVPLDREWGYSLDRIDSSKGYTQDNIQVISYKANRVKNDLTEQELISFAKGVLAVHQGGSGTC